MLGRLSRRQDDPAAAVRPFDADRDGQVFGEGPAVFVLESRQHADARGAKILAVLRAAAAACNGGSGDRSNSLRRAMQLALTQADLPVEGGWGTSTPTG